MRIAYQGAPGAFSHEACRAFAPDCEPLPEATFADVVEAVTGRFADRGILPVSNSSAGPVPGNAELLADERLTALSSHALPVRLHLLALPGVDFAEVKSVASHPMALRQCARQLATLGLKAEEASNTAVAAATLRDRGRAVLASEVAANLYGLDIVRRDLQDSASNATVFTLFARRASA